MPSNEPSESRAAIMSLQVGPFDIPILVFAVMALMILGMFLIIFIQKLNTKKSEADIREAIGVINDKEVEIKMLFFEKRLAEKLGIPKDKTKLFLTVERLLIIAIVILSYLVVGVIGLGFVVAAAGMIIMENNLKKAIYESGVTRIGETVQFMDYFTPAVSSGQSASQAFLGYIQKLNEDNPQREYLVEYWDAKSNNDYSYETPEGIKDITAIYENALYNEEKGVEDYLYIIEEAKEDLFQKSVYYNDFNARVSEVIKPISWAYYIGVPAIILMLLSVVDDFWYTLAGLITAIVIVVLFLTFKFLMNRLTISSLHKIL